MSAILLRRRAASVKKSTLPYDAQVEYLESTGTQYIDTGLTVKSNLRIVFSVTYTEEITGFSKVWGFNASNYEVIWGYENRFYFGGGYSEYSKPDMDTEYSMDYDFTSGNMVAKVNNTIVRQTTGTQPDVGIIIYIFALRDTGNPSIKPYAAKHKAFKIYNSGILVRDFIPVRVGTTGYMYDRVSNQLFGNAGTGSFVLGPDITN